MADDVVASRTTAVRGRSEPGEAGGSRAAASAAPPPPASAPSATRTALRPVPAAAPAGDPAAADLARDRQAVLLMLLTQVCSLHDATPRTFVVHVLALYERGILDAAAIDFLFELGLVPRGRGGIERGGSAGDLRLTEAEEGEEGGPRSGGAEAGHDSCAEAATRDEAAIVPYCAWAEQQDSRATLSSDDTRPPQPQPHEQPYSNGSSNSDRSHSGNSNHSAHSQHLAQRQTEAFAIRQQLERHESQESSARSGDSLGRASAEASFDNPPSRAAPPHATPHASSWAVEHHPLSPSRYRRDFLELGRLAAGAFGAVYRALHKLERRPYAVKIVTFRTAGFYADALALVIREVRCLAQLNHPNCVRYYTSWLEPSWMTGEPPEEAPRWEGDEDGDDEESEEEEGYAPKLLADVERVIEGLHSPAEIDESVEQLEALLYGGGADAGNGADDGFDWASAASSPLPTNTAPRPSSAFPCERTARQDASDTDAEWSDLPSHRTHTYRSVRSLGTDASEWTLDPEGSSEGGTSGPGVARRNNVCNAHASPVQKHYERQVSTELALLPGPAAGAGGDARPSRPRRRCRKQRSSASATAAAATYTYQISFYIQMQLCHPDTLADWIQHRNASGARASEAGARQARAGRALEILRQIVDGLAHVHDKGIIHRDLKPANIFAGEDGSFMLGDFGLSKMIRNANTNLGAENTNILARSHSMNAIIIPPSGYDGHGTVHTAGVGTASYASPEQTTSNTYGTAADIYSLGLIVLELFSNFTSEHERARGFHACRHERQLAPGMQWHSPEVSALVLACTQADWSQRPTARDIRASGLFREQGTAMERFQSEVRALQAETTRKEALIQSQKEQMKEKDATIESLRRRVAKLEGNGIRTGDEAGHVEDPVDIEDSSSCSADGDC